MYRARKALTCAYDVGIMEIRSPKLTGSLLHFCNLAATLWRVFMDGIDVSGYCPRRSSQPARPGIGLTLPCRHEACDSTISRACRGGNAGIEYRRSRSHFGSHLLASASPNASRPAHAVNFPPKPTMGNKSCFWSNPRFGTLGGPDSFAIRIRSLHRALDGFLASRSGSWEPVVFVPNAVSRYPLISYADSHASKFTSST